MSNTLVVIQKADVLQWNSSLVVLVEWNDFDSVSCTPLGSGPRAAVLITTHTPAHQPIHFNWNPQTEAEAFCLNLQYAVNWTLNHQKCPLKNNYVKNL